MKIALIAPPWPLFNRPSIQLGCLKSYLKKEHNGLEIQLFHPYLKVAAEIGFELYHVISQSSWAAEAICSGLLFPENKEKADALFMRELIRREEKKGNSTLFKELVPGKIRKKVKQIFDSFIGEINWDDFKLVGFTSSLNQLTAGLALALAIKKQSPEISIVLGGAGCGGEIGPSILRAFNQVDYVIAGEGELPILKLIHYREGKRNDLPANVFSRMQGEKKGKVICANISPKSQIKNMDELPIPDYDDYFSEVSKLSPDKRFFPILPVEASRGCWWGRCNFCNLNLQWAGYRAKSVERVVYEVDYLAKRHKVLDFAFMDNVLPRKSAHSIFSALKKHNRDYSFFAELRAVHSRHEMESMARGGLCDVQIGIEALSASLLKRLNKGARLIDNIAAMRHAEEFGIRLGGNLIIHFPGSTEREVEETLQTLDFVWPYQPLKTVSFWLGQGSPVASRPKDFNLRAIASHPFYHKLFPGRVLKEFSPLILQYRGDRQRQYRIWKRVEKKVSEWIHNRQRVGNHGKLLSFREGDDFLIIKQVLPDGRVLHHRLQGLSKKLYLFCLDPTEFEELCRQAAPVPRESVERFVKDLQSKKLIFHQNGYVLSLAVQANSWNPF